MTTITVRFDTRSLEMSKAYAAKAARFGTEEYRTLQDARRDYPGYKVVVVAPKARKSNKPSYKGLTYEYMENYILTHDNDEQSIMKNFKMLCGESDEAEAAVSTAASYLAIRKWFLNTYPAFEAFHTKREELLTKKTA